MTDSFSVTFDYRCPFARIAARHVITGLRSGADWAVAWVPFSLGQAHVADGEEAVWSRPDADSGLLAQQVAVAVQALAPDRFLDVHDALFDVRHVHGRSLRDPDVLGVALDAAGVDPEAVWSAVAEGGPLDTVRAAHEDIVASHDVWGVPTFIVDDRAAFVRLMELPTGDADARRTIERVLDLLTGWPELNEFKHTSLDR
jgi:2-hydroxychromene-2-carboxylate isomerase